MEILRERGDIEKTRFVYDTTVIVAVVADAPSAIERAVHETGLGCAEFSDEVPALGEDVGLIEREVGAGRVFLEAKGVEAARGRGEAVGSRADADDVEGRGSRGSRGRGRSGEGDGSEGEEGGEELHCGTGTHSHRTISPAHSALKRI